MSYSYQDYIDAIRFADEQTDDYITSKNYDKFRRDSDPSSTTIQRNVESWSRLKKNAEVEDMGRKEYTKQNCIDALQFADEQDSEYLTQVTYRKLIHDEHPSVKTIQNQLGSWREGKIAAGLNHRDHKGSMPIDEEYFQEPGNEAAYWLGVVFADGYVEETTSDGRSKFTLSLQEKDKSHIELFKNALNSEHKVGHVEQESPNADMYRLSVSRSDFCKHLLDHNLRSEKTHSATLPDFRGERFCHFIRGLFDGDGSCVYNPDLSLRLTGSIERLKRINNWIPVDAKVYDDDNRDSYGQLYFYGDDARKMVSIIYPDGKETEPKLDRKCPL
jgi:hypothetical protein